MRRRPACSLVLLLSLLPLGILGCRGDRRATFDPGDEVVAEHNRGVALMGRFDFVAAHDVFAQVAGANPDWLDARIDLAIATLNRQQPGDDKTAAGLLDDVLGRRPGDLRATYCRAILDLYASEPEAALDRFRQVVAGDPRDAYAHYYAGQCHFQSGNYDQAIKLFLRAQELDPYLRSAYYGAFQAFQQLGDMAAAQQEFDNFQKLADNPQARLAEIKYTRMGPKAEVRAIDPNSTPSKLPSGPLFATATPLSVVSDVTLAWQAFRSDSITEPTATVCDIDQDGRLDLFLGNALEGDSPNAVLLAMESGYRVAFDHPLAQVAGVTAALWGDIDNDGLTDVYLCRNGPNELWQQTAAGTWANITERSQTSGGDANTIDGACFDADHDGDLDLFLVNADGPNELFNNNLDGTFRKLGAEQGLAGNNLSRGIVLADFDNDRDVDILIVNEQPPHEAYRNDRLWNYEPDASFAAITSADIWSAVAADTDADGQVELFTNGPPGVTQWRREDTGAWSSRAIGSNIETAPGPIAVQDLSGDGQAEILVSTKTGWLALTLDGQHVQTGESTENWTLAAVSDRGYAILVPASQAPPTIHLPGEGRYPVTLLSFTGRDNKADQMRSNASGIGVQAAIRVGRNWTSAATFRAQSGRGQSLQPVVVGLRGQPRMDFVSIRWPDGLFQTEIDLRAGAHVLSETQRQVSSCPIVFVWDGNGYQFVTDILGVGGLGFNLGRGEYSSPRPWEHLLLPPGLLQPHRGHYVIKLGEPMEEVMYLDAARLVAYDVPHGWRMALDERLATNGSEPTGQPLFYRRQLLPVRATNQAGQDVLLEVRDVDDLAVEPGLPDHRFLGRRHPWGLTVDFDSAIDEFQNPFLVFHGWVEYPYSQTMFAAWQAHAAYDPPTVEARGADGEWREIARRFGYPAGMPRQAALPLDVNLLPLVTTSLRITTNLEIYFDAVSVIDVEPCPAVVRQPLELAAATVAEVGFPRRTGNFQKRAWFDYSVRSPFWDTCHLAGDYSAFGSVQDLVETIDDRLAVMGPGEEVELQFRDELAKPAPLKTRFFVFEADGWCKDRDLFTQHGETVDPAPVGSSYLGREIKKKNTPNLPFFPFRDTDPAIRLEPICHTAVVFGFFLLYFQRQAVIVNPTHVS